MTRAEILDKAKDIVTRERQDQYGSPENNFKLVADLWTTYIDEAIMQNGMTVDLRPQDVAVMMMLLKIARIGTGADKEDNWIDIAGYAACGGEVESV